MAERLLKMVEAAEQIGVAENTMRGWRRTWLSGRPVEDRKGPEPLLIEGVGVRYQETTVQEYIAALVQEARAAAGRVSA